MHGGLILGPGTIIISYFDFTTQTTIKSETDPQEVEIGRLGPLQCQFHLKGPHWMHYDYYYSHRKHLKKNERDISGGANLLMDIMVPPSKGIMIAE